MNRRPRIVYWDNRPAPYAVERYNTLFGRGTLDFAVWFSRRRGLDRSWDVDESQWRFPAEYIEDPSRSLAHARRFAARCRAARPDLVLSLYGEQSFVVGHTILKSLGVRTALLVLPSFDAWVRRTWWKEMTKHILFRSADAIKTSGPDGLAYVRRYGVPDERVSFVTQSTNVGHFATSMAPEERQRLRRRLGLDGCVFLYVGRIWKSKGLLPLIEAFDHARRRGPAMSLLLVGDGPDEAEIRRAAAHIEEVRFEPFVQARALPPFYAAADVFVFPTLGDPHGQVIEEAHAAGLPIIASNAAGDIGRRVADGISGFVVPAGDPAALARRMLELASDAAVRQSMGARGAERVKAWHHDRWADDFERFVAAAMAQPRRPTLAAAATTAAGRLLMTTARLAHSAAPAAKSLQ